MAKQVGVHTTRDLGRKVTRHAGGLVRIVGQAAERPAILSSEAFEHGESSEKNDVRDTGDSRIDRLGCGCEQQRFLPADGVAAQHDVPVDAIRLTNAIGERKRLGQEPFGHVDAPCL